MELTKNILKKGRLSLIMVNVILTIVALALLMIDLYCTAEMLLERDIIRARKYRNYGIVCSISVMLICLISKLL